MSQSELYNAVAQDAVQTNPATMSSHTLDAIKDLTFGSVAGITGKIIDP